MKKIKDILSGIPSFSGLSENQLEEIQQIIIHKHLNKGEPIFTEGDHGDGFLDDKDRNDFISLMGEISRF